MVPSKKWLRGVWKRLTGNVERGIARVGRSRDQESRVVYVNVGLNVRVRVIVGPRVRAIVGHRIRVTVRLRVRSRVGKNVVDMSLVYVFEIRSKADFTVGNIYTWIFENRVSKKINSYYYLKT